MRARSYLIASAVTLGLGVPALQLTDQAAVSAQGPAVVYDAIGSSPAASYTSIGFQARSTWEFGDFVRLGSGPRQLDEISVMMVNWACESGGGATCATTPGSSFNHPLTLKVYAADGSVAAPTPGTLLATTTQSFDIPFRPSAAPAGECASLGPWKNPATGLCHNGFSHEVTFEDFAPGIVLPENVIWTISYSTGTHGPAPFGPGPWESLNVGASSVTGAPFAGEDISPEGWFVASTWTGAYCSPAAANPAPPQLRFDSCAGNAAFRPLAKIVTTDAGAESSQVVGNTIGGENNTTAEWSYDHFEPKVAGTESVVTDAVATGAPNAPASAGNGSLKLVTKGNAVGTLQQQARVVHYFDSAEAPTLEDVLLSRPKYTVLVDGTASNPNTGIPGAGGLQFGVQCGSWLMSVVLSPGDANPPYEDVTNSLAAFGTWQTFQYPETADPAALLYVATDGGTAPAGFAGFTQVTVADLLDECGDQPVVDARVSQGRNSYPSIVSYFDDVTFLNHSYDFVTAVSSAFTSGTPTDGQVGAPYEFQLAASGTPAPAITVTGDLPPGLSVNAAGKISGTPTAAGTYSFLAKASNGVQPDAVELFSIEVFNAPAPSAPDYNPVGPKRLFDTRPGQSPNSQRSVPKQKVGGEYELEVKVTGLGGLVPNTGVGAVSLNVTATNTADDGFVTVHSCGDRNVVSSLNYVAGRSAANAVISPVSAEGTVCFYSQDLVDLVVDINGWFQQGTAFTATGPDRVFDTRPGQSPAALRTVPKAKVGGSNILEVKLTDLAGRVPASGVGSVSLNVTVANATQDGFLTVYPCGPREEVSSVNYPAGAITANAVIAPVSADGKVCFYSQRDVDLIVDVNGWLSAPSGYTAVSPKRVFDTRPGESTAALRTVPKAKVGGESNILEVKFTELGSTVPATGVSAVSINVTATNAAAPGFVTVYTCGTRELVSSVNYVAGQTVSNAVISPLSATGSICFYSSQNTDLVVDISGWFAAA